MSCEDTLNNTKADTASILIDTGVLKSNFYSTISPTLIQLVDDLYDIKTSVLNSPTDTVLSRLAALSVDMNQLDPFSNFQDKSLYSHIFDIENSIMELKTDIFNKFDDINSSFVIVNANIANLAVLINSSSSSSNNAELENSVSQIKTFLGLE